MKDSYIVAKLIKPNQIRCFIYGSLNKEEKTPFLLISNHQKVETLRIEKVTSFSSGWMYELSSYNAIELGHLYQIIIAGFQIVSLDVNQAIYFDNFEQDYTYDGDDLGAYYQQEATNFALWAPLASSVYVKIFSNDDFKILPMERTSQGVYRLHLVGDYDGVNYLYVITNSGITVETTDPYAFGSTINGHRSVVINFDKLTNINLYDEQLPPFKKYTEAIIYETSVRDLTSDPLVNIKHKGRFLGMIEKNQRSLQGHPIGFDLLVNSGISHLQLLPIYDFVTVDEAYPNRFYNWGYDPGQYFVPEGSYASNLNDPYSRLIDLRMMVSAYHKAGIRIIMDVVFNHVYQAHMSALERVVPSYYFRYRQDGRLSNGSFCGNDIATEKAMVRKLIVDCVIYWVKMFGIDGYRFDLMSNLDIATMQLIEKKLRTIKPDIMLYGEGWNMPTELDESKRSGLHNSSRLPTYAFFNDSFREILKGGTLDDKLPEKGYLLGDFTYRLGFKFAWLASVVDLIFPSKFKSGLQSINYVECHDNGTIFDKLQIANHDESLTNRLKRIKLLNAATMFAFGIPFFHMGQEVGLTKNGDTNSYKSGDRINRYDYRLLDERIDLFNYFKDLVKVRKMFAFLHEHEPHVLEKLIRFVDIGLGGLLISYVDKKLIAPYQRFYIFINPSSEDIYYELDDYVQLIFSDQGYVAHKQVMMKQIMVEALSILIFAI